MEQWNNCKIKAEMKKIASELAMAISYSYNVPHYDYLFPLAFLNLKVKRWEVVQFAKGAQIDIYRFTG